MSLQFLKNLHLLKIKIFFNINISTNLTINLTLLSLLSFRLINALFPHQKNSAHAQLTFYHQSALFLQTLRTIYF